MVIILLALSSALLIELNHLSLSWQKEGVKQRQYYIAVNHILSAISWTMTQSWPVPTRDWQCQTYQPAQLTACIRLAILPTSHYTVVKGQYKQFKQYHLATYLNGYLTLEKGHWIHYCPDNQLGNRCE